MFEDINKKHTTEHSLQQLKQKGPTSRYVADFRRFAVKTKQNKGALRAQFYKGLKDLIKDKITCTKQLDKLDKIINLAITINNCLYKRQLKKHSKGTANFSKYYTRGTKLQKLQLYYRPMPIELNTV